MRRPSLLGAGAAAVLNLAALLGILCLVAAGIAIIFGMRPIIFSTGSMSPAIPAGSLALTMPVAPEAISTGDVLSANRVGDGALVTHRVARVSEHDGLWLATMRGDANQADDGTPYDVSANAQRVVWAAPLLGGFIATIRSPWILVGVVALLVVIAIPTRRPEPGRN